ncbi:SH3 domain-containing protein [Terrihabitans sp. B22-R8]|uniref:SH3 domain-containing protein n=1 Tax=Terrihabitans sp. B22-R8 TaxID=3425128 RepID=UPI00403CA290
MSKARFAISALALLIASAGAASAFPATATTSLNVRSGPGTNYSVVDQLQAGETVEVVSSQGSWYEISGLGWASAAYLDPRGAPPPRERVVVEEVYPSYLGDPLFYYGSDPFFWDDGGYYWYWRGGRRHRVDWDWFRDRRDFRWTDRRHRDRFEDRWRNRGGRDGRPVIDRGPRRDRPDFDRGPRQDRPGFDRGSRPDRPDSDRGPRRDRSDNERGPGRGDSIGRDRGSRELRPISGGMRGEGRGGERFGGGDRGGPGGGVVFPERTR